MKSLTIKLGIGFLGVLLVATIIFAIKASAQGETLVKLEEQSTQLTQDNQELKSRIVLSTSLSEVSKQAYELGMVKPEKYVYIVGSGIALR